LWTDTTSTELSSDRSKQGAGHARKCELEGSKVAAGSKQSDPALGAQVAALTEELQKSKTEFDKVLRNADRRFEEEKRLRKQWNIERRELVESKTQVEAAHEVAGLEIQRLQAAVHSLDVRVAQDKETIRLREKEIAHLKFVIDKYREKIVNDIEGDGPCQALPGTKSKEVFYNSRICIVF